MKEYTNIENLDRMSYNETELDNLRTLKKNFEDHLNGLVELSEKIRVEQQKNCLEVVLTFKEQIMMEDLVMGLDERLGTHILFAFQTKDGIHYEAIGFSEPTEDEMYAIFLLSNQHGVVEEMSLTFFDSIDAFYPFIKERKNKFENDILSSTKHIVLERLEEKELWRIFERFQ